MERNMDTVFKVLLFCLYFLTTEAELVTDFGTFGQGMLVNWQYTIPENGTVVAQMDLRGHNDVPLHIKPYYGSNSLVLDTYKNGRWDRQELPSNFLFQRRTVTNITVYAGATGFDLYSNKGAFHYHYIYRTDVTQITKLTQHYSGTKQVSVGKVLSNFLLGKVVYISGKAPNTCTNFTIDLVQSQANNYSDDIIHLRLKVQLEVPQVVVRNTYSGSRWGVEERNGGMPFSPGQPFTVMVVAQLFGFEVAVNGNHFTYYRYRLPLASQMVVMLTNVPYIQKIEYF